MKKEMMEKLDGMFWEKRGDFHIPHAGSTTNAIFIFKKNLAQITWGCMSVLENNPSTLPQTETILKGQSVGGIGIDDLMQVKNYGDGAKCLIELLKTDNFRLNEDTTCSLHKFVGKEDALAWGVFRSSDISIQNVAYTPPKPEKLKAVAEKGFGFIEKMSDKKEAAIALFLFMSRSQFFYDANKRTASLMLNGYLIKNGFYPITVMNKDSEIFHKKLSDFYETGDATAMMYFFQKTVKEIYPDENKADGQSQKRENGKGTER